MGRSPESAAGRNARRHVVIAGGGVGGLETLLALRAAPGGGRFAVTVVAPTAELVYRPLAVVDPFGHPGVRRYGLASICDELGATLRQDGLRAVDGRHHAVELDSGARLSYDVLVVATGARMVEPFTRAVTFRADAHAELDRLLEELEPGVARAIAFVVPSGICWPLPLYELALLTAARAAAVGADDVTLTFVTPEDAPLAIFHGAASAAVADALADAGVAVETSTYVRDWDGRTLTLAPGDRELTVDRLVALPRLVGPAIPGLPSDADGFVRVDERGRVPGLDDVYAVGDATTFPIKQGGLAAQQGDAVAEQIAGGGAEAAEVAFARPHLRAIVLTGGQPLFLTATITGGESVASTVAFTCPWWPPHKIAGRHLSPFLADRRPLAPASV